MSDTASPWIKDVTVESFQQDVFDHSYIAPVIVDFWAEWCAPCRALAPVLAELANEYAGKFFLVKAETEQVPERAAEFNVEGIPAVYAVVNGEVVDFFSGALPKSQIQEWLDRILIFRSLSEAKQLEEPNPIVAESMYRELIPKLPQSSEPVIGLARVLILQSRDAEASEIIEQLQTRGFLEPEAEAVRATLDLRKHGSGDLEKLRTAAAADPNNFELQLNLAEALAAQSDYAAALPLLLTLVQRDRQATGEKARQAMVDIFRVLPADSELVRTFRRQLSSALY